MTEIVCPACAAINRVPPEKPAREARCGKCHQPLFSGAPAELTAATFDKTITRNGIPVVVDFWADWCGPCKIMAPEFKKAAQALEPAVRFAKLDTEAAPGTAAAHGIRSIPTMILFKDGKPVATKVGAAPKSVLKNWVEGAL